MREKNSTDNMDREFSKYMPKIYRKLLDLPMDFDGSPFFLQKKTELFIYFLTKARV